MPGPTIAAAQTVPVRGDVPANTEHHIRLARAAAAEGVDVLVFPELSLTGYELDIAPDLAFTLDDPRLDPLAELARTHAVTLVVGAPVRLDASLHIGALVLSPDGVADVHTKRHLGAFPPTANPGGPVPPPERSVFAPGDREPLIDVRGRTAALAICADTGRPAHAAAAAARGANAYLAGMFVIPADHDAEAANLAGIASRHAMLVAMANHAGPTGGLPSAGRSAIWSESGELLVRLGPSDAGLTIATESGDGWIARAITLGCE